MSTAIVPFMREDFDRLAEEIRWHEAEAAANLSAALEHYAEAGQRLIRAKKGLKHGDWLPWIEREFKRADGEPWAARYAQALMEFSGFWQRANAITRSHFPGGGLYPALRALKSIEGTGGVLSPPLSSPAVQPFNLPRNDYRIVLADPPWQYESWRGKSKDTRKRRVVEDEYDTMPLDAIKALPVSEICAEDAVLLLWATLPLLQEGLDVLKAWGFQYRTAFLVWGKLNADGRTAAVGFGRYTRSNGELCLLGRRGGGVPPVKGVAIANLVLSPRGKHSAKPDRQYDIIDAVFGREVPRVELFARKRMPRWDVWGLEAPEHVGAMDLEAAG
jgi:N6-adenosine-specific RNA methylase IME4